MRAVISGGVVDAFCRFNRKSRAVFVVAQHIGAGSDIPGPQFAPALAIFVRQDIKAAISPEDQARVRGVSGEATAARGIDAAAAREVYPAAKGPHDGGEPRPMARAWTERFLNVVIGLAPVAMTGVVAVIEVAGCHLFGTPLQGGFEFPGCR
ncbi:MAG: hypothetical protein ACK414_04575 [Gemmobacter sp.]